MADKKKVIVVGAGPNGLTAAAYLAKGGAEVIVVEKNTETGGGLVTEELAGFKMNYHATYMMLAELMPPYSDLELKENGVQFIRPDRQASFLFQDKKSFTLYTDIKKSVESIRKISEKDASVAGQLLEDCKTMNEAFLIPATYLPPLEPIDQVEALNTSDEIGKRIGELGDMSPYEFLDSYKFTDTRVKSAFLYLISMFGLDPIEGGMAILAPLYIERFTQNALVKGGSHQFSSALRRAVEENGGTIIVNNAVTEFIFHHDGVNGVRLFDGSEIYADAVVSTLSPEQNFIQLSGKANIDESLKEIAQNWEWEKWSLFVSNIGMIGDQPRYEGYDDEVNTSLIAVMGYESADDVLAHIEEVKNGKSAKMAGHGTITSLFDPLLVPNHVPLGTYNTLRWECFASYDNNWNKESDGFGNACLEFWSRYAPNIKQGNIRAYVNWSPLDIENHLQTMKRGSIKHGSYTTLQMGYNRPSPECSDYRTPIKGLYLAGASTHPGGMVILGPGYNAARIVAEDLGVSIWWNEPDAVKKARGKGYFGKE